MRRKRITIPHVFFGLMIALCFVKEPHPGAYIVAAVLGHLLFLWYGWCMVWELKLQRLQKRRGLIYGETSKKRIEWRHVRYELKKWDCAYARYDDIVKKLTEEIKTFESLLSKK